jgi:alpha-mannosidase
MQLSLKYADTRCSFLASDGTRNTHPIVRVKFADLSEYGYGVAILSESKYGFSCQGNILRISPLQAATAPDTEKDQGSSRVPPLYLGTIMELS